MYGMLSLLYHKKIARFSSLIVSDDRDSNRMTESVWLGNFLSIFSAIFACQRNSTVKDG